MLNDYPIVHPNTFSKNPLIQLIAKDKNWTVSNNKKIPINARLFLNTDKIEPVKFNNGNPLVSLDELDANVNLQAVNRTYRLKARENRIIAIDVEPHSSQELKDYVLKFPAHLTELSTNGGVHLFIKVPEDLINDENRYMFDDLSVFKEPVPKEEQRQAYYEVIFNDHFITFTKRMDIDKECTNFISNEIARKQLIDFLEKIVELDRDKKESRELAKNYKIELAQNMIDNKSMERIDRFIALKALRSAIDQTSDKTIEDFGDDGSRYEMSVASTLSAHVIKIHKLSIKTEMLHELASSLSEQDLAYSVYRMIEDIVPYRDKHEEFRDGLPWLLYISKKSYEFIKSQTEKK